MKTIIIVPTYNERGNIGGLIESLQLQFKVMSHDFHILVVDDSSPDRTADVVREKQEIHSNVHLLMGQKQGLGAAYIRGMHFALDKLGGCRVRHGRRFLPQAARHPSTDGSAGRRGLCHRQSLRCGRQYIPATYRATIFRTAGFRAIRASLLRKIDLDALRVQGYAFQVALLHEAVTADATIREVPVDFIERLEGESKLGFADVIEFVISAWWIRFPSSKTFINFGMVGLSGVVVNLGVLTVLLETGMSRYLASPIAIEAAIITNFFLNNYWTFRWRKSSQRVRVKGLKFNFVRC